MTRYYWSPLRNSWSQGQSRIGRSGWLAFFRVYSAAKSGIWLGLFVFEFELVLSKG